MSTFHEFLVSRLEAGGFSTEDVLASFLPLARQAAGAHAAGKVAPLDGVGTLQVESGKIWLDFAVADRDMEEAPLAAALLLGDDLGLGERFRQLAGKELGLRKKTLDSLEARAEKIVAGAAAEGERAAASEGERDEVR